MGSNFATDLANSDLDLSTAIEIHLTGNHYPPVPKSMVLPCIEAIEAYWDDETDRQIQMPEGVSYKGLDTAPAWAIVEQHHLQAWCDPYYPEEE
jgi:hypothetical protein